MYSVLGDDPESFADMAREHSVADTAESGGYIGKVTRGSLQGTLKQKSLMPKPAICSARFRQATVRILRFSGSMKKSGATG